MTVYAAKLFRRVLLKLDSTLNVSVTFVVLSRNRTIHGKPSRYTEFWVRDTSRDCTLCAIALLVSVVCSIQQQSTPLVAVETVKNTEKSTTAPKKHRKRHYTCKKHRKGHYSREKTQKKALQREKTL